MLATILVGQEEKRAMHNSELWFLGDFIFGSKVLRNYQAGKYLGLKRNSRH